MEEVPDEIPDLEPVYEELEETIPEPPPLKRASKLTEKVTCPGCSKILSLHAFKYSHKCKARAPEDPVPAPEPEVEENPKKRPKVDRAALDESLKDLKPQRGSKASLTEKQSMKPVKQRAVIKRAEKARAEPPAVPQYGAAFEAPQDLWSQLMSQRALQSRMRAEAAASPYAQMFAQQRSSRVL